jgi:hypothetical protein
MKDRISVMISTHIVNVETEPYLHNEMLYDTISTAHEKLNLGDTKFYIYIDKKMEEYEDLFDEYLSNIENKLNTDLSHINVEIVEDRQFMMRGNWHHMIDNCETPYLLFLEHDWEFVEEIPIEEIMNKMDEHSHFNYVRFPYTYMGPGGRSHWDVHGVPGGGHFKVDDEIGLPLTQCTFYSGNPHIVSIDRARKFYKPIHMKWWPPERTKGTSHLEKEIMDIILKDIQLLGTEQAHKRWGCFIWGVWGDENHKPSVKHLGDWCRKK